jgi:hydroxyacylglutathione hydrolase
MMRQSAIDSEHHADHVHAPKVLAIPAFEDNYIWLIHDGKHGVVVDPGDAEPVIEVLRATGLHLSGILITHHHGDHTGGIQRLAGLYGCAVIGPKGEDIAGLTRRVDAGDAVALPGLGLQFTVLDVPGHTRGHVAYYCAQFRWLFPGDTLFAAGCGRLFEGTHEQMFQSLSRLAALPDDTRVFCAHEYTLNNLAFALAADPHNPALIERVGVEEAKRRDGLPTIPTTIAIEKRTNPFLRTSDPDIVRTLAMRRHIEAQDPVAVFAGLRDWKDVFRG